MIASFQFLPIRYPYHSVIRPILVTLCSPWTLTGSRQVGSKTKRSWHYCFWDITKENRGNRLSISWRRQGLSLFRWRPVDWSRHSGFVKMFNGRRITYPALYSESPSSHAIFVRQNIIIHSCYIAINTRATLFHALLTSIRNHWRCKIWTNAGKWIVQSPLWY
jgi:hypothetical protein